jgi:hypothetical protein
MSLTRCLSAAGLVVLVSCAAPKAVAVADPVTKKPSSQTAGDSLPKPVIPGAPQDGIRLPDNFLSMPGEAEFRATAPTNTSASSGAVIVRPPSDPVIPPDIGPKDE